MEQMRVRIEPDSLPKRTANYIDRNLKYDKTRLGVDSQGQNTHYLIVNLCPVWSKIINNHENSSVKYFSLVIKAYCF